MTIVKFTAAAPLGLIATLGADRVSERRRGNCGATRKSAAAVPQNVRRNLKIRRCDVGLPACLLAVLLAGKLAGLCYHAVLASSAHSAVASYVAGMKT